MKAYNQEWIYNRDIIDQAERWYRQQLLSDEQIAAIRKAYPVNFRQTNGFIEIGLFLFTTVALLACYLLPASLFGSFAESALVNIGFGIGLGVVGQLVINERLLYRNGVDNAFIVTMTGFLAFGLTQLLPNGLSTGMYCLFTLPLLLAILWYYGDTMIAFFTLVTFYAFVFDSLIQYGWGKSAMPFVIMVVSLLIYQMAKQLSRRNPKWVVYYSDPLDLAQWISLIALAAAGNYFVVRELNGLLLRVGPTGFRSVAAPEIALPWLFWLLTFMIPLVYLWQGVVKRNRILLILGAVGVVVAFMTVHEYVALLPVDIALTLGGLTLISIAVVLIRYLAQPKRSFTDAPDDDSPNEFWTNAATVIAVQAASTTQHKDDFRFGGGNFGGGGSEGNY